ncbi:MAG: 30S ribosome-binding factor RbfA [Metamycoplasmataceae bacterium]
MNNINLERKTEQLHQTIAYIINEQITNVNINGVTVIEVKLTPDLSFAKIFVSFINNAKKGIEALNNSKGYIRTKLSKILDWRKVPELTFVIDEVSIKASKIDEILRKIKEEK